MLSNHAQSMFEYLAPRRGGGGGAGAGGGGGHPQQPQQAGHHPSQGRGGQNEGYKDMVY